MISTGPFTVEWSDPRSWDNTVAAPLSEDDIQRFAEELRRQCEPENYQAHMRRQAEEYARGW
jgi:hypothetical protein